MGSDLSYQYDLAIKNRDKCVVTKFKNYIFNDDGRSYESEYSIYDRYVPWICEVYDDDIVIIQCFSLRGIFENRMIVWLKKCLIILHKRHKKQCIIKIVDLLINVYKPAHRKLYSITLTKNYFAALDFLFQYQYNNIIKNIITFNIEWSEIIGNILRLSDMYNDLESIEYIINISNNVNHLYKYEYFLDMISNEYYDIKTIECINYRGIPTYMAIV